MIPDYRVSKVSAASRVYLACRGLQAHKVSRVSVATKGTSVLKVKGWKVHRASKVRLDQRDHLVSVNKGCLEREDRPG